MLNGCSVRYTDKNRNKIMAKSGDVIYVPVGSEYEVDLTDFEREDSHTVGINFHLPDESGGTVTFLQSS